MLPILFLTGFLCLGVCAVVVYPRIAGLERRLREADETIAALRLARQDQAVDAAAQAKAMVSLKDWSRRLADACVRAQLTPGVGEAHRD